MNYSILKVLGLLYNKTESCFFLELPNISSHFFNMEGMEIIGIHNRYLITSPGFIVGKTKPDCKQQGSPFLEMA